MPRDATPQPGGLDDGGRLARLAESLAFTERTVEHLSAEIAELNRRVRDLTRRLGAMEDRLGKALDRLDDSGTPTD